MGAPMPGPNHSPAKWKARHTDEAKKCVASVNYAKKFHVPFTPCKRASVCYTTLQIPHIVTWPSHAPKSLVMSNPSLHALKSHQK